MPGANLFGLQVEANIDGFFGLLKTLFNIESPTGVTKVNQVSGLSKAEFSLYLNEARI
jgi:hypothetical protein